MKPPRNLKIADQKIGSGRLCVPGDTAVCACICTQRKGDVVFATNPDSPYQIEVGRRDYFAGIEYGLLGMRIDGRRTVIVPPNLIYYERKTYPDIPENALLIYEITLVDLGEKWDPEMEHRLDGLTD